jgi:methyl-accepting chemotaxis protein
MEKGVVKKQRYFIERDLFFQTLTLLLTVLLGGFLLLLLSKTISGYIDSSLLFLMLFVGYFLLIIFFAWSLSRKFIGPFSRLKENLKDISNGDLSLRLHVRNGDDVRIKSFVDDANRMIIAFNNCLEKIKLPCQDLEKITNKLIYKVQSDSHVPQQEYLDALQELQQQMKQIRESADKFNTRRQPSYHS